MYAAIWIDEGATQEKRVVVCKPFVRSETAAWAALNSQLHKNKPSIIIEGDPSRLEALVRYIEEQDGGWGRDGAQVVLNTIAGLAIAVGLTPKQKRVMRESVAGVTPENIATEMLRMGTPQAEARAKVSQSWSALAAFKKPAETIYPNFITEPAKEVWRHVLDKYADRIFDPKAGGTTDRVKQWAIAIVIFRRACTKRGINPFDLPPDRGATQQKSLRRHLVKDIRDKMNRGSRVADKEVMRHANQWKRGGYIHSVSDPKFYEAIRYHGKYFITSYRSMRCKAPHKPKELITALKMLSDYTGRGVVAHTRIDEFTDVLFEIDDKHRQNIEAYVTTRLSKEQAKVVLGIELSEKVPEAELLRKLERAGRKWVRTGNFAL